MTPFSQLRLKQSRRSAGGFRSFIYFFPIQLLVLHFKKNHALLAFTAVLFAFGHGLAGAGFGVSHLFLFPEYRGQSGFTAYAILGFAFGGYVLAFNLYTYILHGYRFQFIATLSRPFVKFSLNNSIIPGFLVIAQIIHCVRHQLKAEMLSPTEAFMNTLGLPVGTVIFLTLSYLYFARTNHSPIGHNLQNPSGSKSMAGSWLHRNKNNVLSTKKPARWKVETYFVWPAQIKNARKIDHYEKDVLESVLRQNHVNASLFELVLFASFLIIGGFGENALFTIPAAASAVLLFTMLLMLFSALFTWLRGWTYALLLMAVLVINRYHEFIPFLNVKTEAYGLDYNLGTLPVYGPEYLKTVSTDSIAADNDSQQTIRILDNWRKKQSEKFGDKPKLVIMTSSGGGHRSALWTMTCLRAIHQELGYPLTERAQLITGSSGGLIGAAYYRELHLRNLTGQRAYQNLLKVEFRDRIALDILNPLIFKLATNDVFIRYRKFKLGEHTYTKDRAYAFEEQLNANTQGVMEKSMSEYCAAEATAQIPMLIMSPTIVHDGRRLLISSTPVSYLSGNASSKANPNALPESIDFAHLFGKEQGDNLRFTSGLRMNATFPYILPMTSLPSNPPIQVMDAGLRDNFGTKLITNYLFQFRNWINSNTSGVVIVQFRDLPKNFQADSHNASMLEKLVEPLGSVYTNVTRTQDYTNDQLMQITEAILEKKVEMVMFQMMQTSSKEVSLSWHLSQSEKAFVIKSIESDLNRVAMKRLVELLEPS